jgi:hypothetical protein
VPCPSPPAARVAMHRGDLTETRSGMAAAVRLSRSLTRSLTHLAVLTRLELANLSIALADVTLPSVSLTRRPRC